MTLGDLQGASQIPQFAQTLQGGLDYLTPVLKYLQSQPPTRPIFGGGSLSLLRTPSLGQPGLNQYSTNTQVGALSNLGLLSNGKLVENYLTSQQLVGATQVAGRVV